MDRDDELLSHYPKVVAYLMRLGHDREEARDLAQETYLQVHRNRHRYRGESIGTYLRVTAHNLSANRRRDAKAARRDTTLTKPLADDFHPPDARPSPEFEAIRNQEQRLFDEQYAAAMRELPDVTRQIISLRRRNHSFDDIARMLGITSVNARSRASRAAQHLRERIRAVPGYIDLPEETEGETHDEK